jgi:DUF4097 and DUF4098 domain-containing protein YvlB
MEYMVNKTIKIILAALWLFLAVFLTVILVNGINGNINFPLKFSKTSINFNNDSIIDGMSVDAETEIVNISEKFSKIDVELISEKFIVEVWNNDYTEVTIVSSFPKEKRPKVLMEDNTLKIKTPNRNNVKIFNTNDSVTIKLPSKIAKNLSIVDVEIVSGSINISEITTTRTSLSTVSGSINFSNSLVNELNTSSVSGSHKILDCNLQEVNSESISGSIQIDSDIAKTFDCSSVSGSIKVETNTMPSLGGDCEATSGSVKIYLPENEGFVLNYDSISGSITNNFTGSKMKKSGESTYKNGNMEFDVETVSGSILIERI